MNRIKKVFAILALLVLLPIAFAEECSIKISAEKIVNIENARENGIPIRVFISCNCEDVIGGTEYLEIYVVRMPKLIVYQDIIPLFLCSLSDNISLTYTIPPEVIKDEGVYYVRVSFRAIGKDFEIYSEDAIEILVTSIEASAIKIIDINPNISEEKIFRFNREEKIFFVDVMNLWKDRSNLTFIINIKDLFENEILSKSFIENLLPFERKKIRIPIDFSSLSPGRYFLEFVIRRGMEDIYKIKREIIVEEDRYIPVIIRNIRNLPFDVKAGDFVELKMIVKNTANKPESVKIIIFSRELNIYKESDTIELDPNEVKELSFVIKIPENVFSKYYTIYIIARRGLAEETISYKIYVEGIRLPAVEINIIKPEKLEFGEENEFKLIFRSNVEKINKYIIKVEAENADIKYDKELTIGGVGAVSEKIIKVYPRSQNVVLNINVYSEDGKNIFSFKEEYKVKIPMKVYYDYIYRAALIILAIVIIIVLSYIMIQLLTEKKIKRRKVEKSE